MGIMASDRHGINILVKAVLEQNYFAHNHIIYQQMEGLAMGAPTSSIFSEVFVQYLEHTQIAGILTKYNFIAYHRYVDDILIIYNNDNTNIEHLLSEFNGLHIDMQFTIDTGIENKLNVLDVTIHRMQRNLQFGIYRKPTVTYIMIHNQLCHPSEHKWSGIAYLINRLRTYSIENKLEEKNIIEHLLIANGFHQNVTDILKRQKQVKIEEEPTQEPKKNG
jgi:hypothetical protein